MTFKPSPNRKSYDIIGYIDFHFHRTSNRIWNFRVQKSYFDWHRIYYTSALPSFYQVTLNCSTTQQSPFERHKKITRSFRNVWLVLCLCLCHCLCLLLVHCFFFVNWHKSNARLRISIDLNEVPGNDNKKKAK